MKNLKRLSVLLTFVLLLSAFAGCSGGANSPSGQPESNAPAAPAQGENMGTNTHVEDGTPMELWVFQDLHATFYEAMADVWNQKHPDKAINLTVTSGESAAMQTKMLIALQSGVGGPDIADIEVGNFGNFIKGEPYLLPLNDIIEPEKDNIVFSRVEMYSGDDGNIYGIDFHVGASVTYYNMDIMNEAGVDPASIVTWDQYREAGRTVLEKTGKPMMAVETADLFVPQCMLLLKGTQYLDDAGRPNLNTPEHVEVIDYIRGMIDEGLCLIAAGGNFHREEWYGQMNGGAVASITMPLWYMSRFTDYMTDLDQKIGIYPDPVWNEGDVRSVCQGGTGTGVTVQADNPDLAKEFLAFAKLSEEGNIYIWEKLGFDPIRTSLWTDEAVIRNPENKFVKYFLTNPFDVLNQVGPDLLSMSIKGGYAASYGVLTSTTYSNAFENATDTPTAELLEQEQATIIYDE